jgi:signal transduction histidine kinase
MGMFLNRFTSFWVLRRASWFGLLASSCVGLLFYLLTANVIDNDARLRFTNHARNAQNTISARIKSYTDALRGAASLFQTSDRITREQFHAYVAGLSLQRHFPALVAINYAEYVRGDEAEEFVRRVRAEQAARPFGDRVFNITPPGKRAEYSVLTFIEDESVVKAAFGFDIFSVPHAARVMLTSRDTGTMITSGQPVAAISKPHSASLAMRLPVYRPGMSLNTVDERRAAYIGSIGIGFNIPQLVKGILDEMPVKNVRMVLTDNGAGEANRKKASPPPTVLFDSSATAENPSPPIVAVPNTFTASLPIDYNGRRWNATFTATKTSLYSRFDEYFPWLAMASGFGGSMLIYALFHSLSSSRSRAITMANSMTQELRDSQANLQLSHHKLRRLVAHADQIKEGERKRIAREIHDDLGQNLLALRIEADLLATRTAEHHPRLNARARMTLLQIDATIKSVRQIINDLRPNVLDLGLSAAVEWQVAEFIRRTGIKCQLVVGRHDINVNDNCATAFFRILQESLSNIVRHAKANTVRVELNANERDLWMTIEDNGVGLPDGGRNKPGSFGLVGIEERINILGGSFSIHNSDGGGTSVFVSVPISEELRHAAGAEHSASDTPEIALA